MKHFILTLLVSFIFCCFSLANTKKIEQNSYLTASHLIDLDSLDYFKIDSILKLNNLNSIEQVWILERLITKAINQSKYEKALAYVYRGLEHSKINKLDSAQANFLKQIGVVEYYSSNQKKAINSFKHAAQFAQKKQLYQIEASCYNNIGGILIDQFDFEKAEYYLKKSIEISEKLDSTSLRNKLMSQRLLATLYTRQNRNKEATEIFRLISMDTYLLKDTNLMCSILVYYAEQLAKVNQLDLSIQKTEEALKLMLNSNDKHGLLATLGMHARNLEKKKRFREASEVRLEMLELQKKLFNEESQKQFHELETKYKVKNIEQEKINLSTENELKQIELEKTKTHQQLLIAIFSSILFLILAATAIYLFWKKSIEKQKQAAQQQKVLESVIETQEKERIRIAKELHDGIVQSLTALKLNLNHLKSNLAVSESEKLNKLTTDLNLSVQELRNISYQMMPLTLNDHGLILAIEELLPKSLNTQNIHFEFNHFDKSFRFNENIEVNLYRICQELLNNAIKHSKASTISLILKKTEKQLLFIFEDNGIGFKLQESKKGIGLNSIISRVDIINGSLEIDSQQGKGTSFFIQIPI